MPLAGQEFDDFHKLLLNNHLFCGCHLYPRWETLASPKIQRSSPVATLCVSIEVVSFYIDSQFSKDLTSCIMLAKALRHKSASGSSILLHGSMCLIIIPIHTIWMNVA